MSPPPSQTLGIDHSDIPLPLKLWSRHVQSKRSGVGGTRSPTNLPLATHSGPKRAGSVLTRPSATCSFRQTSAFDASYATNAKPAKPSAPTSKATSTISPKTTTVKPLPPPVAFQAAAVRPARKRITVTVTGDPLLLFREDAEREKRDEIEREKKEKMERDKREKMEREKREKIEREKREKIEAEKSELAPSSQEALDKIRQTPAVAGATATAASTSSPTYDNEVVINAVKSVETGDTGKDADPAVINKEPTKKPPSVILKRAIPPKRPMTVAEFAKLHKELKIHLDLKPSETKTAKSRLESREAAALEAAAQEAAAAAQEAAAQELAESQREEQKLAVLRALQLSVANLKMKADVRERQNQEKHEAQVRASERATYSQWKEITGSPATQGARIQHSYRDNKAFYEDRSSKLLEITNQITASHVASAKVMKEINEPGIVQRFRLIQQTHASLIDLIDAIRKAFDEEATYWEDLHRSQEAWRKEYMAVAHLSRQYTHLEKYYPNDRPELRERRVHALRLRGMFEPYWTAWDAISKQLSEGNGSIGTRWARLKPLENDIRKVRRQVKDGQVDIVGRNGWFERMDVWRAMNGSLIDQELLRKLRPFWLYRSRSSGFTDDLLNARLELAKERPTEASRSPRFRTMFTMLENLNRISYGSVQAVEEYEFAVYDSTQNRAELGLLDRKSLRHWHVNMLRKMLLADKKRVRRGRSQLQQGRVVKEKVAEQPWKMRITPRLSRTVKHRKSSSTHPLPQSSVPRYEYTPPVTKLVTTSRRIPAEVLSGYKPAVTGKANGRGPTGDKGRSDVQAAPKMESRRVGTSKASATRRADRKELTDDQKSRQPKLRREAEKSAARTRQQTLAEGNVSKVATSTVATSTVATSTVATSTVATSTVATSTVAASTASPRSGGRKRRKASRLVSNEPRTVGTSGEARHDITFRIWRKTVSESIKSGESPANDAVTSNVGHSKLKSNADLTSGPLNIHPSSKLQLADLGTPLDCDYSAPTVAYDLHLHSCCIAGCGETGISSEGSLDHLIFSSTRTDQDCVINNGIPKAACLGRWAAKVTTGTVDTKTFKVPPSSDPPSSDPPSSDPPSSDPPSGSDGRHSDDDSSHPYRSQGFNGESESNSSSDPSDESSSDEPPESGSETELKEVHVPLSYQIPEATLQAALLAPSSGSVAYWTHAMYRGPNGEKVTVHYCRSMETTDNVAKLFLDKSLLGFDIEWRPDSRDDQGVKNNVSLVQLACEDRIALFHIALHKGETKEQLLAPTLKSIMESPKITKAGVHIRGDCTRLRKFLGIESQGVFELSHLYRLVKYSTTNRKLVNKRLVSLAQQVEEHLQLPLNKGDVRQSDWSKALTHEQVVYAASDSYAAVHLFDVMERKRKEMDPTPPRPAHAELNLPISMAVGVLQSSTEEPVEMQEENDEAVERGKHAVRGARHNLCSERAGLGKCFEEPSEHLENESDVLTNSDGEVDRSALRMETLANTLEDLSIADAIAPPAAKDVLGPISPLDASQSWVSDYLSSRDPSDNRLRPRASAANLRAYYLWQHRKLDLAQIAGYLRDPPLALSTVALYTLDAVRLEDLAYDKARARRELLGHVKEAVLKTRYRRLLEEIKNIKS